MRAFHKKIACLLILLCLSLFQFQLLWPSHRVVDLPVWDEAQYLGRGTLFLSTGKLPLFSYSPFYSLFYSLFTSLFGTMHSFYIMKYFLSLLVSVLLYIFLYRYLKDEFIALVLASLWCVTGINLTATNLVYHFALSLFLLSLFAYPKDRPLSLLFLALCVFAREEYALLLCIYALVKTVQAFKKGRAALSLKRLRDPLLLGLRKNRSLKIILVALMIFMMTRIDFSDKGDVRLWLAFKQHFSLNLEQHHNYAIKPFVDYKVAKDDFFPGADSLPEAFLVNPKIFLRHLGDNMFLNLPEAVRLLFLPIDPVSKKITPVFLLIILFMVFSFVRKRRLFLRYIKRAFKNPFLIIVLAPVLLLPSILIYPKHVYVFFMVPLILLCAGVLLKVTAKILFSGIIKHRHLSVFLALIYAFAIVLFAPQPYRRATPHRMIYNIVAKLDGLFPDQKFKLLGLAAETFASYLGRTRCAPIEPLSECEASGCTEIKLDELIYKHRPDVVTLDPDLVNSARFDKDSVALLFDQAKWKKIQIDYELVFIHRGRY